MRRRIATTTTVDLDELLDFARPRHHLVLVTHRKDGGPQVSPVTGGVDQDGRIVISTYPERAKATNARRDPQCRCWCSATTSTASGCRSTAPAR